MDSTITVFEDAAICRDCGVVEFMPNQTASPEFIRTHNGHLVTFERKASVSDVGTRVMRQSKSVRAVSAWRKRND